MRSSAISRVLVYASKKVGALRNIVGVAVGQYKACGPDDTTQGDWTAIDVLRDKLGQLQVPILGAEANTLTVEAAVS